MFFLTTRIFLPFYIVPLCYYFLKFIFVLSVIFALCVVFCSTASSAFRIHDYSFLRSRLIPRGDPAAHNGTNAPKNAHYTNTWVSHIEGNPYAVQKITEKYGYVILDEIFPQTYHLLHPDIEGKSHQKESYFSDKLNAHPEVLYVQQQLIKRRSKRDFILLPSPSGKNKNARIHSKHGHSSETLSRSTFAKNDPKWEFMWYLNRGHDRDMNVRGAWEEGYSGLGIVVTILDDGLEKDHPDLAVNYDPQASYDVNSYDEDPTPRYDSENSNRHGTRCAGEIAAAANNKQCSVGVAFRASIGGVRMLDGDVTDAVEARSLNLNPQHIDIYSASWGPDDDGKTVDGPGELAMRAFVEGVTRGRGGKGSIFVWASGNGGRDSDNCNCDGYTNSVYTLSVSSATEAGRVPWYSENCSSTIATTYSSGAAWEAQISTTDLHHDCTGNHTGTSASAPLAAGICALALEANTELTWRDMQHIVIATARPKGLNSSDWRRNGVNRLVSHSFGYGLMDATAMVKLAKIWKRIGPQQTYETSELEENITVPAYGFRKSEMFLVQTNDINYLEHVQIRVTLSARRRGDVQLALVSPSGTRSVLLTPRSRDNSRDGFISWPFMTVHCWGEFPGGMWILEVSNTGRQHVTLHKWSLKLYGTEEFTNLGPEFGVNFSSREKEKKRDYEDESVNMNDVRKSPLDAVQNSTKAGNYAVSIGGQSFKTLVKWSALWTVIILALGV